MKSRSFLLLLIERALVAIGAEEEAGDPGRGAAHHIADRAEVSLRRALDNELIMHRADDETVAGRMGGRLSIPLPSGTAVPAPLREGSQGTRKGVKDRPAAAESLTDENLPRPHYPFCPPGIFPKGEDFSRKSLNPGAQQKKEMAPRLPHTQLQEARKTFLDYKIPYTTALVKLFLYEIR